MATNPTYATPETLTTIREWLKTWVAGLRCDCLCLCHHVGMTERRPCGKVIDTATMDCPNGCRARNYNDSGCSDAGGVLDPRRNDLAIVTPSMPGDDCPEWCGHDGPCWEARKAIHAAERRAGA